MQIVIDIPDHLVQQLIPEGCDAARTLLEEFVASAYRDHRLTAEQTRLLLGYGTRMQVDAFLQKHEIYDYTIDDFDRDVATGESLHPSLAHQG